MTQRRRWMVVGALALALAAGGTTWYRLDRGRARPRLAARPAAPSGPRGIIIHHSDTPGIVDGQYVGATLIGRSHARRGFGIRYAGKLYHIGYHYVIREDGVIEPGRPEHCPGAHALHHNDYLGICLVGDFSTAHNPHFWTPSQPTPPQLRSLVRLCRRLMAKYHIPPDHVIRHCDVCDTACPGDRFPYAWLEQQLSSTSSGWLAEAGETAKSNHPLARVPETRRHRERRAG